MDGCRRGDRGRRSAELSAHGYRQARSTAPSYLVSYQLNVDTGIRSQGSISIDSLSLLLREAKSMRRVWVAFVQTEGAASRSEDERRQRLREVVRQMLLNFPPRPDR